ncbi:MAG: prepilin-type N-terminal cleavage/methylation domain-containing protein [Patescibacteria group bacterium]|nr:prepilin-type N-terminal cleavage/methylation domain-containing protein [Patescibacteria group bacterium]
MKKGFTLIEILIIISLIAILATLVIYFINPIEIGKRNRDLQRIKDLQSLSWAINTYLSTLDSPDLDGPLYDLTGLDEDNPSIYFSLPFNIAIFNFSTITDAYGTNWKIIQHSSSTNLQNPNGEGWLPINFSEGHNTLPSLPIDPINALNRDNAQKNYFYLYVFKRGTKEYELNAKFESKNFKSQEENDGGSDKEIFEVGNNKCLLAFGTSANVIYGTTTLTSCRESRVDIGLLPGNFIGEDICWNKLFDFYPTRNYIFRNKSGDYLLIGNNFLSNTTSIYLILLDKFGNYKLAREIILNTTTKPINLNYVHQMDNGDYILSYSFKDLNFKASFIVKINQNLNPKWARYYCSFSECTAFEDSIFVTEDNFKNINLVRNVGNNNGFQLINISSSTGEIIAGGNYKYNIPFGRLYSGNKTEDGGFILLGSIGITNTPPAFLAKFDSQNNFEWIKHYQRLSFSSYHLYESPRINFVFQTNDNGYFFTSLYDTNLNTTSYNFVKTDYQGNIEWIKKYNGDYSQINIRKIFQDKENNFWLVINRSNENYLIKLDKDFNKLKEFKITPYDENDDLILNNFYQLDDKRYILLGNLLDSPRYLSLSKVIFARELENIYFEEITNLQIKYYFNLIKFLSENNIFYLKNNLYNIATKNIFSFSNITSSVSEIASFTTSSYAIDSYPLNFTSRLVNINQKILVNQCDDYFSKNLAKNRSIEKMIKIDDGYVIVGKDFSLNPSSFWITKINTNGEIISSNSYRLGDNYLDHKFESITQEGNNFVVIGSYKSELGNLGNPSLSNSSLSIGYIAKFSNNLNILTSASLNFMSELKDIIFDDNHYLIIGFRLDDISPRGIILKVNPNSLNIEFSKTDLLNTKFNSILLDEDKNYLLGGEINNESYLIKVNSSTLTKIFSKSYLVKQGAKEEIKKIIFDKDDNIISLSNLFDPEDNKFKIVLRKINPNDGEVIKENIINNYFYSRDIILDYNDNFLISGYLPLKQEGKFFSDWSLGLMKVTKDFDLVWIKYYGGQSRDEISFGSSIVEAYEAGYLIGGYNGSNRNAWLLKVSYNGDCLGCFRLGYLEKIFDSLKNNLANFLNLILR